MPETFAQKMARETAALKRQARSATAAPRLENAALYDTDMPYVDRNGRTAASWGKQPDGSAGGRVIQSPAQPTPSAPVLPDETPVASVFPIGWAGSVLAGDVPLVHGHTEVWGQFIGNDSPDVSQARLMGTIRDRAGGSTTVTVGKQKGMWAFWLRMVGQDRTTKGEFSAPAVVEVASLVDASDIEERLNAFADGELGDAAYENLLVRLGEFMNIRADQIDVNSLAADAAFIGLLEAAGIVLADEAGGRRTEISGQGLTITDTTTGDVLTQLGTFTDSLFTIMADDGTPSVTMTQDGGVSAVRLSSTTDPTIGGKSLAGAHFNSARWHVSDSVVDLMPQGSQVHWDRVSPGETFAVGPSQTGIGITHLEMRLAPNRIYKLKCHHFEMADRTNYWMQAFTTTSTDLSVRPPRPTVTTPNSTTGGPRVHGTVPPQTNNYGTALSYEWARTFSQPTRMRVIFAVGNSSSVENVFGSLARQRPFFSIEDVGPSTGPKGTTLAANMGVTNESIPELADDLAQAYQWANTATYSLNLSTRIATRAYSNGTPRFGQWDNGVWYMTLVEFADWSAQPGIKKAAKFNVSVERWLRPANGEAFQAGVPTFTGLPASFNFDTDIISLPTQRNVARYAPRTVNVSGAALDTLLPRSRATIAVGRTSWGADSNYPASGFLNTGTNTRLSTELGGGVE